jgi:hypothetical protein
MLGDLFECEDLGEHLLECFSYKVLVAAIPRRSPLVDAAGLQVDRRAVLPLRRLGASYNGDAATYDGRTPPFVAEHHRALPFSRCLFKAVCAHSANIYPRRPIFHNRSARRVGCRGIAVEQTRMHTAVIRMGAMTEAQTRLLADGTPLCGRHSRATLGDVISQL